MPLLQTSHQQSLTITLPTVPFIPTPRSSSSNTLKFTFPLHPSTTCPDTPVNNLRNTLPEIPLTHTILTLPPHSTFSTGLHWHESHIEYLHCLQGKILITIANTTKIVSHEDGPQEIPRGVVHAFQRADTNNSSTRTGGAAAWEKEDVVVAEFTLPADTLKEVMFRNGVSAFLSDNCQLSFNLILRVLVIMGTLDQFPMVVPWSKWLSWVVVHGVFGVVVPVLRWWGVRGWEREWTPRELWGVAGENEGERERRSKKDVKDR